MLNVSGITLSGGSNSLTFDAQVQFDEQSGTVSLIVVTFDPSLNLCFKDSVGLIPQGPVVTITSDENVTNAEFRLFFVSRDALGCGEQAPRLECG